MRRPPRLGRDHRERPLILFVDDEPNILRSLRRELFDTDFTVHVRTAGADALEVIAAEPVAVVVADLCMPDMDGVEFLERVHRLDPTVVRVLLTGYANLVGAMDVVNRCRLFRLLVKPWDRQELLMTLRTGVAHHELLRRHQAMLRDHREQQRLLADLEKRYPGITANLDRREDGAFVIQAPEVRT